MFYQRVVIHPALGKVNEVRALVKERVQGQKGRLRSVLTERVFGKGSEFIVGVLHDHLESLEKQLEFTRTDQGFIAYQSNLASMLDAPVETELYSVIHQPALADAETKYTHLVRFTTSSSSASTLEESFKRYVKSRVSEGALEPMVLRQRFSPMGSVYVVVNRYASITEYENIVANTPLSIRQVNANVEGLLTGPITHALYMPLIINE